LSGLVSEATDLDQEDPSVDGDHNAGDELGDHAALLAGDADRDYVRRMAVDGPGTYVHAEVGLVDDNWLTVGSGK